MKKIYFTLACLSLGFASISAQEVATFEDLNLAVDSYWDDSDESAMFTSGGYTFINNFTDWGGYTSWDGFAYSTMTSTAFDTLDDQYNSCVGCGAGQSQTYAVAYYSAYMGTEPTVIAADAEPFEATSCYVTNAAYAYQSMLNGDSYSKKFDESDWFLLTATGYLNDEVTGTVEKYLAKDGKILNEWELFDLSELGTVDEIHFTLSSSDSGQWGMNTPAYFCLDNFGADQTTTHIELNAQNKAQRSIDLMGRQKSDVRGLVISNGTIQYRK